MAITDATLESFPFHCINCSVTFDKAELFCSQLCQEEASWVRYVRRCRADGRDQDPKVIEAIKIRLALILGGGYDKSGRRLSEKLRQLIIDRDGGRCRICGAPGDEIDHINGSSPDPTNLQLLCDACHNKKTVANFKAITKDSHPKEWAKAEQLRFRARAKEPILICDADSWNNCWRDLKRRRRDALIRQKKA